MMHFTALLGLGLTLAYVHGLLDRPVPWQVKLIGVFAMACLGLSFLLVLVHAVYLAIGGAP